MKEEKTTFLTNLGNIWLNLKGSHFLKVYEIKECDAIILATSCKEAFEDGERESRVYPLNIGGILKSVYCDMTTEGGGWTVIQSRGDFGRPQDYFLKNWVEYKNGFGNPEEDFWLGLEAMHKLGTQQLLIELEDFEGEKVSVIIDDFHVGDEQHYYTMTHGNYTNDHGRCFPPSGTKFSTIDRDNDVHAESSCATSYSGAWWYTNCHCSNINGLYLRGSHESYADGIEWASFKGAHYSLKNTAMKVRAAPQLI